MPPLSLPTAALVAALALGCGDDLRTPAVLELTGDPARAAPIYDHDCASCHGLDAASGSAGITLADRVDADLATAAAAVLDGVGDGDMPGFAETFDDQAIADLLAYLRAAR